MTKKESFRSGQSAGMENMIREELKLANHLYPMFVSPMEGLGILQEELHETRKDLRQMEKFYVDFQNYLCEHQVDAAGQVALKMGVEAKKAALELIQVAAMCQKFVDSEGLW